MLVYVEIQFVRVDIRDHHHCSSCGFEHPHLFQIAIEHVAAGGLGSFWTHGHHRSVQGYASLRMGNTWHSTASIQ